MRIYDTTAITTIKKAPWKAPSLDFIQKAYREQLVNVCNALLTHNGFTYTTGPHIIAGSYTFTGSAYNFTAGMLVYNNELFDFDPQVVVATGPVLQGAIQTTYDTADPTTYSDLSTGNAHQIRKVVFSTSSILIPGRFNMTGVASLTARGSQTDINALYSRTTNTPWANIPNGGGLLTSSADACSDGMGNVKMRGFFTMGLTGSGSTPAAGQVFGISPFHPIGAKKLIGRYIDSTGTVNSTVLFTIHTDGSMQIDSLVGGTYLFLNDTIYVDSAPYTTV